MPRTAPTALVLSALVALALATGCTSTVPGTAAPGSGRSAATTTDDPVVWVDGVCAGLLPFIRTAGSPPQLQQASDPAALVRSLSSYLGQAQSAADSAISSMAEVGPSPVEGGDEVVARLSETLTTFRTSFQDARTRIDAVDPNDQQSLVTELPAAITPLQELADLPDPTAALQSSPELNRASEQAASCQQIERENQG
jgi:hypothetical protein